MKRKAIHPVPVGGESHQGYMDDEIVRDRLICIAIQPLSADELAHQGIGTIAVATEHLIIFIPIGGFNPDSAASEVSTGQMLQGSCSAIEPYLDLRSQ